MKHIKLILGCIVVCAIVCAVGLGIVFYPDPDRAPDALRAKGFVCGRQGNIIIRVEHPRYCLGDSQVLEGALVTLEYSPKKKRHQR